MNNTVQSPPKKFHFPIGDQIIHEGEELEVLSKEQEQEVKKRKLKIKKRNLILQKKIKILKGKINKQYNLKK
jgi:hypothetical protein